MLQPIIDHLDKQWAVISQAPTIFVIAAALIFGLAFAISKLLHGHTISGHLASIASLEHRLKLKDDRIADYERKLEGATPDEAKARIQALEHRLEALAPRRLSEEDKKMLAQGAK